MFVTRSLDRSHVVLPDGRAAEKLRLAELRAALGPLGIPGITADMGKDALLNLYEAHVSASMPEVPSHPRDLTHSFASRARAMINQADSRPAPVPASPPIASTRV